MPPGGAAARAGLQGISQTKQGLVLGDVITAIDEQKVQDFDDLYNALDQRQAGDAVKVGVNRHGEALVLTVPVVVLQ